MLPFNMIGYIGWLLPVNFLIMVAYLVKHPKYIVIFFARLRVWYYGFSKKHMQYGKHSISYIEHGHFSMVTPSILMVHGYSSCKENWIEMIRRLPPLMHVIAIDLPGHGDSNYDNSEGNLGICYYAKIVKKFVDHVGLNRQKFHLVGQSMGGGISGVYACNYPEDLLSVSMLCPYGIQVKQIEEMQRKFQKTGNSVLLPQNTEGVGRMIQAAVYNQKLVSFPPIIKVGMLEMRMEIDDFLRKLLEGLVVEIDILEKHLTEIKIPTLVLWGREDQILDVECVEKIRAKLEAKPQKIVVLDRVGHILSLEVPEKSVEVLLDFINSL